MVWKSDESDWASWMYSPAGWRCSLTKVNLVGLGDEGLVGCVDLGRFCRGGDLLRGSFSSAEDIWPSSSVRSRRLESKWSW